MNLQLLAAITKEDACAALLSTGWPWPAIIFALIFSIFLGRWLHETVLAGISKIKGFRWLKPSWGRHVLSVMLSAAVFVPLCAPLGVTPEQWLLPSAGAALGAILSPFVAPSLIKGFKKKVEE